MADHFSGPRALADPASDITDVFAFPSPERPGHLVLVLDVFPVAPASALFSDALTYRFRLRPLTARATEGVPAFGPGPDEYRFDLTFDAPAGRDGGPPVQSGTCITPSADRISFRVGEAFVVESDGLRLFAGPRLDPFFIDLGGVLATSRSSGWRFGPWLPTPSTAPTC
jgi:hypothetical protein